VPATIGFIGAGNIARIHMKDAQALGMTLAIAADPNIVAANEAAALYGVHHASGDWRDVLVDKSVQAVVVASPNKFHAEQAIAALQAGKHVFLEKPMALNLAEADAILAAVKKSGRILQMGMSNRFRAGPQALKQVIDAGVCGHIYAGETFWYRRRGIPGFGGWFTTKAMSGGGALIDIGVHMIDLAMHLMSFPKPVAVSGTTFNIWKELKQYNYTSMWGSPVPGGKKDVDDYAVAIVRFDQGQILNINVSWSLNVEWMDPEMGVRIMGDKGGVALHGMDKPHIYTEQYGMVVDTQPYTKSTDAFAEEMKQFDACICGEATPTATAEQGRTVQSILDAIYRSGDQKREVDVE
jgi:predicted dehydrogenase